MPLEDGELLTAERFCRWPVPCQVGSSRKRSTRRFPPLSMPMLERLSPGPCWSWPSRMRIPLGRPFETKRSPLTPATVAIADTRCWIAVTRSRPRIASLESTGLSAQRPPGRGIVSTWMTEGPWNVNCTCFSYVTPGMSSFGWPAAGVARTSASKRSDDGSARQRPANEASERLRTSADRDIRCQWRSGRLLAVVGACGLLLVPLSSAAPALTADQQLVAGLGATGDGARAALQSLAKPSPDRATKARADIARALAGISVGGEGGAARHRRARHAVRPLGARPGGEARTAGAGRRRERAVLGRPCAGFGRRSS